MKSCTNWRSASRVPNISRGSWRGSHISSSARSATPISRMQWWMRPGPRRSWAILKPAAWRRGGRLGRARGSRCRRSPSGRGRRCGPCWTSGRTSSKPGRVGGDQEHRRPLVRGRRPGRSPPSRSPPRRRGRSVVHHLRPLITHSSPSQPGGASEAGRVRARRVRLGHRVAAADVALEQRLQPRARAARGRVLDQDLHVARCPAAGS